MPEQYMSIGFRPSIERLKTDLHHLLCIFLASKPLAELIENEPGYTSDKLMFHEIEDLEVTRLFLTTAITLRVLDDREDRNLDCFSMHCGTDKWGHTDKWGQTRHTVTHSLLFCSKNNSKA